MLEMYVLNVEARASENETKKLMVVKLNSNAFLVRVRVLINVERNKMLPGIIHFLSFASE